MKLSQEISPKVFLGLTVFTIMAAVFCVYASVALADRTAVNGGNSIMTSTPCNAASSTLGFIQTPFTGATSTAENITIHGLQGATTTDMLIGTSTQPSWIGGATSTVAENVMGLFSVTAGTQFMSMAGAPLGPGTGYTSPSGGTYKTNAAIVVGPNEGLLAIATTTNPSSKNGTTTPTVAAPQSCTIDVTWFPIF